ncbi:PorP/SprF family type IX secretion system membrane protein [Aureispira anguillae]|uniref:PorP/SprF family type IX secretion system membrane protein n=1 Tax=Aureispira anguillae TaxID=2864201 RepID=A0A916DTC2_9BACT|nr:PorP/SprF family type IX secretion system membrane protein [Aureispira anguillae]BDS11740.1 PorP/SprF family type IX secretion system membrane protein [Aureispira anguillae]
MKILKSVCLLFIVGFCTSSSQAQDIHYTMFDMAPLELNPVYTGYYAGTFRVGGIYRTQWAGLSVSTPPSLNNSSQSFSGFQTPSAYIDVPFGIPPKDKSKNMKSWAGVGVSFYYDAVGNVSNLAASLSLAYHLGLGQKGNTIVSLGVQGGILQRRISGDYTFEDQLLNNNAPTTDPLYVGGNVSKTLPDFSGGLMVSHRGRRFGLEAAASLNHFTNPNYSFKTPDQNEADEAKLPMTIIANLAMKIALTQKGNLFLRPLFFFQNTLNTTGQGEGLSAFDLNGQLLLGIHFNDMQDITLYLGGGYRVSGDAIARIGLDIKGLKFGFAYDINTHAQGLNYKLFNNNNRGMAFEVALSYVAKIYKVPVIDDVLICPRF